jgi:methylmalonyl-CoA/ethylmalonyl-CoA epimerase
MLTRVHHVGLVVRRLEDGLAFWGDRLGLRVSKQATVEDQGVRAALLPIGRSEIELLEPVNANGGVAKFLERRGEGLHHVCFETPNVGAELAAARNAGFPLIDEAPRAGLAGMICFLHPKGTASVLVEFATPPAGEEPHAPDPAASLPGLALREIHSRSRDAAAAAGLFETKLGLDRTDSASVSVGGVQLRFVAGSGSDGLAGLVLELPDLGRARARLGDRTESAEAGGITLDPARCHGVPISILSA